MICDHWTLGRHGRPSRCRYPARFRVRPNKRPGQPDQIGTSGETPCGLHVRPYLMDNGDSVWQPWIVEPLAEVPND